MSDELQEAVENNDVIRVKNILDSGVFQNLPCWNDGGMALLMRALAKRDGEITKLLLGRGAKVNREPQKRSMTPLHLSLTSMMEDELEIAQQLLELGAKVNACNANGSTPLHQVVFNGNKEAVQFLLRSCANVDCGLLGETPLFIAVERGHEEIAKILLASGAQPNLQNAQGSRPLHVACQEGKLRIISLLLKHGASVNAPSKYGTPLDLILSNAKRKKVEKNELLVTITELLAAGANANVSQFGVAGMLDLIVCLNSQKILSLVLKHMDSKSFPVTDHHSLISSAVTVRNFEIIELLAAHNFDTNSRNKNGFTPLHVACSSNDSRIAQRLLELGADVEAKTLFDGRTPLHISVCTLGHKDLAHCKKGTLPPLINVLLKYRVSLDTCDKKKSSLFHYLSETNNVDLLRLLFQYAKSHSICLKSLVSSQDLNGFTPLHIAAKNPTPDVAKLLLNHGARDSLDVRDDYGLTPLHIACRILNVKMIEVFLMAGANPNALSLTDHTPAQALPWVSNQQMSSLNQNLNSTLLESLKILLTKGADMNRIDKHGDNTFLLGVEQGSLPIVQLLLQYKPEIANYTNKLAVGRAVVADSLNKQENLRIISELVSYGLTFNYEDVQDVCMLYHAIQKGCVDVVNMLVEQGADCNSIIIENQSMTPLLVAVSLQIEPVVTFLLKKDVDVNVCDIDGFTPLHYAARWGHVGIIEYLLQLGANVNCISNLKSGNVSPLHVSVKKDHERAALVLLRGGAKANLLFDQGTTALHYASERGNISTVKNLLMYGADPRARNNLSKTPLGSAICQFDPEVVCLLLENGGYSDEMCCLLMSKFQLIRRSKKPTKIESRLARVLTLHSLEMEILNKWPPDSKCRCRSWIQTTFTSCNQAIEIQNLKKSNIMPGVNFYSVIAKSKPHLVQLAKNKTIYQFLSTFSFLTEFPIFGQLLEYRWQEAVIRMNLLEAATKPFNSLILESIRTVVSENLPVRLNDSLDSIGYGWLLSRLNCEDSDCENSKSVTNFLRALKQTDSLLPEEMVERITRLLSNEDLENLVNYAW